MNVEVRPGRAEMRIRLAHQLQILHGIDVGDMAEILGLSLNSYQTRLRRLQLDAAEKSAKQRKVDPALERLQAELNRLLDAEELPDKSKAEALMALARAVKTVNELAAETVMTTRETGETEANVKEARHVLIRINRRIEELAEKRAREILGTRLDAKATDSGREGMADTGA
ncbi:hypothetical protein AAIB41_01705 [Brucella sp. BE17]|uniref:hypothetical protein n=1 Tax=Brucella sp. BE17 TaxID=3142977 RepID=UPI0031BB288E